MSNDPAIPRIVLFAAALAIALFAWVEVSLRALDGTGPQRASAQTVAPGLSIAVMHPQPARQVANVALNGALP